MKKFTLTMTRTYETIFEVEAESVSDAIANLYQNNDRYAVELEQCCVTDEKIECIAENEATPLKKYAIISTWNGEGYSYLNTAEVLEFKNDYEAQTHLRKLFEEQQSADDYEVKEVSGILEYSDDENSGSYVWLREAQLIFGVLIYPNTNEINIILNAEDWRDNVAEAIKQAEPEEVSELDLTEKSFFIPAYNGDYDYQFIKF